MFFCGGAYNICKYTQDHHKGKERECNSFPTQRRPLRTVGRVVVVGGCGCGKSALFNRVANNNYCEPMIATIGVDLYMFTCVEGGLQIWDMSGRESFIPIVRSYYKGFEQVDLVIVCGCVDLPGSMEKMEFWIRDVQEDASKNIPIICVETKIDLVKSGQDELLSKDTQEKMQQKYKILKCFRVSAKTGIGANELKNFLYHFHENLSLRKRLLYNFALTCRSALLQISEMAENKFSGNIVSMPNFPQEITNLILSFLGDENDCKRVVNMPQLKSVLTSRFGACV